MKNLFIIMLTTLSLSCTLTPEQKAKRVMRHLSTREKIAQLITVSCDSYNPPAKRANRNAMVRDEHIGGLIVMQDRIPKSMERINELQRLSPIPLIVSIDGEWGPSMRYGELPFFPRQMQLGATDNDSLIYEMGKMVAEECKLLNIWINFAPVADINVNPNNPVIGARSFGENKERVTRMACAYMHGMQDGGIYACAKHFPGHGDTDVDSHLALPTLPFSRERLDSLELYPFRHMIDEDVALVMIGHLHIPAIDTAVSTLSSKLIKGMLQKELGFKGLVVSDALNMDGVRGTMSPAEVTLAAYKAGVEMLLMPDEVSRALDLIEAAINRGECSMKDLNKRCLKILTLKAKAGMLDPGYNAQVDTSAVMGRLELKEHHAMVQRLSDETITLVDNHAGLVPLNTSKRIAYVAYNAEYQVQKRLYGERAGLSAYNPFSGIVNSSTTLYNQLHQALPNNIDYFTLSQQSDANAIQQLNKQLKDYDMVILACHDQTGRPQDRLIPDQQMSLIEPLITQHQTLLVHFGTPYGLNSMPWLQQVGSLIIGYSDNEANEKAVAKVLLDIIPAKGKLPVSAGGFRAANAPTCSHKL